MGYGKGTVIVGRWKQEIGCNTTGSLLLHTEVQCIVFSIFVHYRHSTIIMN